MWAVGSPTRRGCVRRALRGACGVLPSVVGRRGVVVVCLGLHRPSARGRNCLILKRRRRVITNTSRTSTSASDNRYRYDTEIQCNPRGGCRPQQRELRALRRCLAWQVSAGARRGSEADRPGRGRARRGGASGSGRAPEAWASRAWGRFQQIVTVWAWELWWPRPIHASESPRPHPQARPCPWPSGVVHTVPPDFSNRRRWTRARP